MALQGKLAHGHLRIASAPPAGAIEPSRARLLARALLVRLGIVLLNVVAVVGAAVALAPLLVRRRPLRRRRPVPQRTARVIPLEPRRRASPG